MSSAVLQKALYDRLSGNVGAGVEVFDFVPYDRADSVLVVLGRPSVTQDGDKGRALDRHEWRIEIYWVEQGSLKGRQAMQAVRDRIHGAPLTAAGWSISAPVVTAVEEEEIGDGVLYRGVVTALIYVQPA